MLFFGVSAENKSQAAEGEDKRYLSNPGARATEQYKWEFLALSLYLSCPQRGNLGHISTVEKLRTGSLQIQHFIGAERL